MIILRLCSNPRGFRRRRKKQNHVVDCWRFTKGPMQRSSVQVLKLKPLCWQYLHEFQLSIFALIYMGNICMDLNWHPFKLKFPAKLVLTLEIVRRYLELGYIYNICITSNRMVATPKSINFAKLKSYPAKCKYWYFFCNAKKYQPFNHSVQDLTKFMSARLNVMNWPAWQWLFEEERNYSNISTRFIFLQIYC